MGAAVQVLERKTVGAYDVSVLAATESRALGAWLERNGYRIPDRARKPIGEYIREKWTFVACRVKNAGTASGLRSGTRAPIRLTFRAARPVYPVRISSANPAPFGVLIYLVLPRSESGGNRNGIINLKRPGPNAHQGTHWRATLLPQDRRIYPTIAKLSREPMDVYVSHDRLRPEDSNRDYVWRTRGSISAGAR